MSKIFILIISSYLLLACGVKGDPLPPVRMDKKMTESTDAAKERKENSKKKKKVYQ